MLTHLYNRVERSRSPTPIVLPFDPDDPEQIAEDLRVERKAYESLVDDNSRPCYPIEPKLDVFNYPDQYKNLFHTDKRSQM